MVALTGPASLNALGASARQENQGRTADREPGAPTYRRIKTFLDSIPSIDTHQHLAAFDQLFCFVDTDQGRGVNLYGLLWKRNFVRGKSRPWQRGERFETWWAQAKNDFDDIRAKSSFALIELALRDLYGVDLDRSTDAEAQKLDRAIFANYRTPTWLQKVITERANIELCISDRFWARFNFQADYPFEFLTLNVTPLVWGFHPSEFRKGNHSGQIQGPLDDPYLFARQRNIPLNSLGDYLVLLDRILAEAKRGDAICLKTTLAYVRTLQFDNVPRAQAARVFGRPASELTAQETKAFEDFIIWRLVELSAKYEMPFQFHTGEARLQGSNPMLLVELIDANPKTKFVLFHGGYPWVGETGAIGMKYPDHVWLDGVWLPTLSYSMAKRAFAEWLEAVPSNHILWGSDEGIGEGIYGATECMRRCWAEVLAEKIDRGDLLEANARQIGEQIFRNNALELYPRLRTKLWRQKATAPSAS